MPRHVGRGLPSDLTVPRKSSLVAKILSVQYSYRGRPRGIVGRAWALDTDGSEFGLGSHQV